MMPVKKQAAGFKRRRLSAVVRRAITSLEMHLPDRAEMEGCTNIGGAAADDNLPGRGTIRTMKSGRDNPCDPSL